MSLHTHFIASADKTLEIEQNIPLDVSILKSDSGELLEEFTQVANS